jgi:hypothetical protein
MASIVVTFIEPDPAIEFGEQRLEAVRDALPGAGSPLSASSA